MSNSLSLIAHNAIRLIASELLIACRKGLPSQDEHCVGLEVWLELAGCCNQSEGVLLHRWIPILCTAKCPVGIVYKFLHLIFFFDQGRVDGDQGYSQVEEQFFPWF